MGTRAREDSAMLLQDMVQIHAGETPESTAIVSGKQSVCYRALEERSNQLARSLIRSGCGPGDRVGLLMPKSIEAITGLLGILKAGSIYVPLDPKSPAARLGKIVE